MWPGVTVLRIDQLGVICARKWRFIGHIWVEFEESTKIVVKIRTKRFDARTCFSNTSKRYQQDVERRCVNNERKESRVCLGEYYIIRTSLRYVPLPEVANTSVCEGST